MDKKEVKILMCGSKLNVKGGIVSVIKNYLGYQGWGEYTIKYIPTHTEKSKPIIALFFAFAYFRVVLTALFGNYDVIYLHTAERGSFYRKAMILRTLRKFHKPVILHHHAAEFELFYQSLSEKKKQYVDETLRRASLNIVLSQRLIPMITEKSPQASVKVLYNAVATYEKNPYNRDASHVLFLGRLGERKGTYDLLKVIKELDASLDPSVKFYLCGDGEVEEVKAKVREYGIKHRILHVGWTDGEQKKAFFRETMINVLPSYNEGLPMTILETMAYGIPNISTNIASIPEVIREGENGYMITPGDTQALSEKLLMLSRDKELRIRLSEQAEADIKSGFSLDHHITVLKGYIDSLLS